jgi:hypothetical protein
MAVVHLNPDPVLEIVLAAGPDVSDGRSGADPAGAADEVRIRVRGRKHPQAADSSDGNWLVSPITVRAGGFVGDIPAGLRAEELVRFREGLEHVLQHGAGTAVLHSIEEWLSLAVVLLPSGVLDVSGAADDQPGIGNTLRFTLPPIDGSRLADWIAALKACEAAYPPLAD